MSDEIDDLVANLQEALDRYDTPAAVQVAIELRSRGVDIVPALFRALGADEIEVRYAAAMKDTLTAMQKLQRDPADGDARLAFNAADLRLSQLSRVRQLSGRLTSNAQDAERLAGAALVMASQAVRGALDRLRFAWSELVIAGQCCTTAQRFWERLR